MAKTQRNLTTYVEFLNAHDWSQNQSTQHGAWIDLFWPNQQQSTDLADMLLDDSLDTPSSGLDVYDPAMEKELNTLIDSSMSGATSNEPFGFTTGTQSASDTSLSTDKDSKAELYNLIKQHELQ